MARDVFTFTDFGAEGPYLAQVGIQVRRHAPGTAVHTLVSDAPRGDPMRAGYLLAALIDQLPVDAVVIAVVDPGVGGARLPLAVEVDGRFLVGPDNGLLAPAVRFAGEARARTVDWRPDRLSASFHGRDLFAPTAGFLSVGREFPGRVVEVSQLAGMDHPIDLAEIVYLDRFGNAFSGIRAGEVPLSAVVEVDGARLPHARTFSDVPAGTAFWYGNSCGLVELAANGASAAEMLGLKLGSKIRLTEA